MAAIQSHQPNMSRQPNMTDYDATYRDFRWEVPAQYNFAVDTIGCWAQDPARLALWWVSEDGVERTITYAEMAARSDRVAAGLRARGIGPGDRVLLMLPRVPAWWESFLALLKLGAVAMPGTVLLTPKDIRYRLESAEVTAVITDEAGAARVDEACAGYDALRHRVVVGARDGWQGYDEVAACSDPFTPRATAASDPAILYFTSGTTGYPKMVLHTHASYPIGHTVTGRFWLDLQPGDVLWNLSETGWAKAAWSSLFGPWSQGATVFTQDARGRFDAKACLRVLEDYPITTFCAPPTAYRMLVLEDLTGFRPRALRHCVGAGEPLNPEVIAAWQAATGLTVRDGYGQTETVLLVGNFPPLEVKPGAMGRPSPGFVVDVIDEAGRPLPPGREGDIAVRIVPERPVGLFQEYWRDPEATQATVRGDWYVTGDRAYRDADGYLWFVGRADDVIISAGYRIGPFEVESALVEHEAVAEAAVVAAPDPTRGAVVKAYVILASGYEGSEELARELQEHVKTVTAPYKHPRQIVFVSELPKTISGKIRRVELRERACQEAESSGA
jgi:acyl-coenzyme A synthetase/AMP-(fatty) acid ligase